MITSSRGINRMYLPDIVSIDSAIPFYNRFSNSSVRCFWIICERRWIRMKHEDIKYIFVAHITLRNGRRIYAKHYGLKAFRIPVKRKK